MNSYEDVDLLVPFMVYQAINEKFKNEQRKAESQEDKCVIQKTHLLILEDFVEKYLGFDSETFLDEVREERVEKSGTTVGEVQVTELNLYYYKLGTIFWNSIPLLQEMEMVD